MKRLIVRCAVSLAVLAGLAGLSGCAGMGRGRGPVDAFTFQAGVNKGLSRDVVGAIDERVEPKEIRVVVPAGTDLHSLVATLSLSKEAVLAVVSSGSRVAQQNGVTPNDFSVPVTYSIAVTGDKQPWTYRVFVREAESNARLSAILVPPGSVVQPAFSPTVRVYTVDVPFATSKVRIEARGQTATLKSVTIDGAEKLGPTGAVVVDFASEQERIVAIATLAEDGVTREQYTLTIRRGEPDSNASLAALDLKDVPLTPAFSPAQLSYQAVVPFETTRLAVRARPQSAVAGVTLGSAAIVGGSQAGTPALRYTGSPTDPGAAQVDFSSGNRLALVIVVTAEDQSVQQYLVDVLRAPPDRNNLLSDLSVAVGGAEIALAPQFTPGRFGYTAEVPYSARQVSVLAMTQSRFAAVSIEAPPSAGGARGSIAFTGSPQTRPGAAVDFAPPLARLLFVVAVTAQDGSIQRYTLDLRRAQPDGNAFLQSLLVSGAQLSPGFNPSVILYDAKIAADVESVAVTALPQSQFSTVAVDGQAAGKTPRSIAVQPGAARAVIIDVTAQSGVVVRYTLRLARDAAAAKPPEGGESGGAKPGGGAQPGGGAVSPPPADTGSDRVLVAARNLKLQQTEAAAIASAGDQIGNQARVTVRYYRTAELITQYTVPVDVKQQGGVPAVTLSYRSNGVTMKRDRLVEVETAIPTSKGHFLFYTEAQAADAEVGIELPFLLYGNNPQVRWPLVGSPVQVGGYLSKLPLNRDKAVDKEDFDRNANGEYAIGVEIVDSRTGTPYGRDAVSTKPGQGRGRTLAFGKSMLVPEGATVKYLLSAKAKNGKVWSATDTTQVWTTRMSYPTGFMPVLLFVSDDLAQEKNDRGG